MIEIPSLRPETRYGIPSADHILFNRHFVTGYSYLMRQPSWALELIDETTQQMPPDELERLDNFREDLRIPEMFRATLDDYRGSGFDRGHLVASADRLHRVIANSETFLMSNMTPQHPRLNQVEWRALEDAVRQLAARDEIVETYAICGPLFNIGDPIEVIGENRVVVPDAYFKSVLCEMARANSSRSQLSVWTFVMQNAEGNKPFAECLAPTSAVERWAGLSLWDRLRGENFQHLKDRAGEIWEL